jgi:hypothetical protein
MATVEISKKIVGWSVARAGEAGESREPERAEVIEMHERIKRPETLVGSTYKIKSPNMDAALYITINDIVLNEGTEHERRRPFEIFINSRDMSAFQWVTALTLVISAVFRKGGDFEFLVDELKQVFDPKGGYFARGGFVPSVVADIGWVLEQHLTSIGAMEARTLDEHQRAFIEKKKAELAAHAPVSDEAASQYPASAAMCGKCATRAVVRSDGCDVCLSCGASKCG